MMIGLFRAYEANPNGTTDPEDPAADHVDDMVLPTPEPSDDEAEDDDEDPADTGGRGIGPIFNSQDTGCPGLMPSQADEEEEAEEKEDHVGRTNNGTNPTAPNPVSTENPPAGGVEPNIQVPPNNQVTGNFMADMVLGEHEVFCVMGLDCGMVKARKDPKSVVINITRFAKKCIACRKYCHSGVCGELVTEDGDKYICFN